MSFSLQAEIKTIREITSFEEALNRYVMDSSGDAEDEFKNQLRLATERAYKLTPPKTRKQGRDAVRFDLEKIFVVRNSSFINWLVDRFGDRIDYAEMTSSTGRTYEIRNWIVNQSGSRARMNEFHQRNRTRRGNIRKPFGGSHEKMIVSYQAFAPYLKSVQKRVGDARSGWLATLDALGSKIGAGWVRGRGASKATGVYQETHGNHALTIRIANQSEFAESDLKRPAEIKAKAFRDRVTIMQRQLIDLYRGRVKRLGEFVKR